MSALNLLLLLAVAAGPGGAIRCYTCSSDRDPHCADPMDRGRLQPTECNMDSVQSGIDSFMSVVQSANDRLGTQLFPHGDTKLEVPIVCQKIYVVGVDGRNHTVRMCSLKDVQHGDLCQDFKSKISPQNVVYCGVCEEDGCNGAGRPAGRWLGLLLLPLAELLRHG